MTALVDAANTARQMLHDGQPLPAVWRHVVLQTLDVYEGTLRIHGVAAAAADFGVEPPDTGDLRVDAALAALAEYLARRDGWPVPSWARDERRSTLDWWFIDDLPGLQVNALRESPLPFRKRGVFIGEGGLHRV